MSKIILGKSTDSFHCSKIPMLVIAVSYRWYFLTKNMKMKTIQYAQDALLVAGRILNTYLKKDRFSFVMLINW